MKMNELKLDMHSLDEAWLQQPELSHKYGVQLLEAEMLRTRLKDKLDITKAEIDLEIRENVTPKPTESAINSLIVLNPKYKEAMQRYFEAEHKVKEIKNMTNSIEAKRKALEGLSELYVAGYFASRPMLPNPSIEEKHDETQNEITEKLNAKPSKRLKK